MPFYPLPESIPEKWKRILCQHPEHNPPALIVINHSVKWVCPACGRSVTINPRTRPTL